MNCLGVFLLGIVSGTACVPVAYAQEDKPNLLVIMADDVGYWNLSHTNRGMMGCKTPNIDRAAEEETGFSDYDGEQSCTAGRAAFTPGQHSVRTDLTKAGMSGVPQSVYAEDPRLADPLMPLGYATSQCGKNHLCDGNEFLPTVQGFDAFYGNLDHLHIEEEPELPDFSADPALLASIALRGVLGINVTEEYDGITGHGLFADGIYEHDGHVGQLLDTLVKLGIAENTLVVWTTDNGAEVFTWPDRGTTPFKGEKATTWEDGLRVPATVRWSGNLLEGLVVNGTMSYRVWVPTIMGAVADRDVKDQFLNGYGSHGKTFNVFADGYNMLDNLALGAEGDSPRRELLHFTDDGDLSAVAVISAERLTRFLECEPRQEASNFSVDTILAQLGQARRGVAGADASNLWCADTSACRSDPSRTEKL